MMTSFAHSDVFKISLILLLISSVLMVLVKKVRTIFSKNKLKALIYAVVLALLFALTGFLAYDKVLNNSPTQAFMAIELIFFILGIIHVFTMRNTFKAVIGQKLEFLNEFMLTLVFLGVALFVFIQVVSRFRPEFVSIYMTAGLVFITPFLVLKTFEYAMAIPVQVYKKWLFPIRQEIKEPTASELSNPLVISLEFKKKSGDKELSRFKVKAPEQMEFGKLFYFFVDDYNALHPERKIEITDNEGGASAWIFYFKPRWWRALRHIDANKTIEWNGIREENSIVVQRVEA
ncbi:TssN family type VI secretion system protein [Pseudotamlana carrageenivorans]|nr:TssN family type VI secretion system protein [Tamlana carrageenivorans]